MRKKLIIFDCDGVLVDSEYLMSALFSEILASYGVNISVEESVRRFTGINDHEALEMIAKESGVILPPNYWSSQLPTLDKIYETKLTALMQPVLEILDLLNLPRCIASNNTLNNISKSLKLSQQAHYFSSHFIFSAQQVEKPKPAPDIFLFAAKSMGFEPQDCIVVEDSHAGTEAAIAAGMEVMIFLAGNHARYDWYRDSMKIYNRTIVSDCQELFEAICTRVVAKD